MNPVCYYINYYGRLEGALFKEKMTIRTKTSCKMLARTQFEFHATENVSIN